MLHPEFERAEFRDDRFDLYRHDLSSRSIGQSWQLDFQQAGLFQLTFGIRQYLAGYVAASRRRREESEFCGPASHKAERPAFYQQFGSLLHALRHGAQRFDRWSEPGNCWHRAFEADVI